MRNNVRTGRGAAAIADDEDNVVVGKPGVLQRLGWSHRDAVGVIVGAAAIILVLVNMLFLQPGPHRAPIVKSGVVAAAPAPGAELASTGTSAQKPRVIDTSLRKADLAKAPTGPAAPAPAASAVRPPVEVVADIQRELSRRGYYDGVVDGRYGPRTDAAIRDFEQAAGLRPSGQPNEDLLRAIMRSPAKARPAAPPAPPTRKQSTALAPPRPPDPIGDMLTPSSRVMAVQRALSEFGYGQINPSGIVDSETQRAIERFERERRLPVTGQLSHRVVRELASITGRPLE